MENCELTVKNCESTRKNCELTVKNCELTVKNCESTMKNCELTVKNCELTVKNCGLTVNYRTGKNVVVFLPIFNFHKNWNVKSALLRLNWEIGIEFKKNLTGVRVEGLFLGFGHEFIEADHSIVVFVDLECWNIIYSKIFPIEKERSEKQTNSRLASFMTCSRILAISSIRCLMSSSGREGS